MCPGLRELLQRMVVPHIAGGAGVVGYGGWVTGVAWGRTFGEWMGIVIKNDVSYRNMFVNNKLGEVGGGEYFI